MSKDKLYCNFCGKSQAEVRKLIAGPTVFICDECVGLCAEIIEYETWQKKFKDELLKDGKVIVDLKMLNPEKQKELKRPDTSLTRFESFFKRNVNG